jgi:hypothetical protein
MNWTLDSGNCSQSSDLGVLKVGGQSQINSVTFTTKIGSPQPDLVAATDGGTCAKTEGYTFNITKMLPIPIGTHYNDQDSCPVLSPTSPTPNPCLVEIDSAAAANITADIQAKACAGGLNPAVTCPTDDSGAPGRALIFSVGGAGLAAFGWVAYVLA